MTSKYQKLLNRRAGPGRLVAFSALNEKVAGLRESEDVKYILGSMEPLDADYTKDTLVEAERVHKYLEPFATIRLQGSVTTNTHIRYHSDVDILVIADDFTTWEGALPVGTSTYQYDPVSTLKNLRARSRKTILSEFPQVKIDDKDRALSLSGGSLARKVDVVVANWYETVSYVASKAERDRGVQVLSMDSNGGNGARILNKPFLHQHLLIDKNTLTNGGLNRAIRLLKTLKVDAESDIKISSYDICALVWNMDINTLPGDEDSSLLLANNCAQFLLNLVMDENRLALLDVPNRTRKIVSSEGTTLADVRSLWHELYKLLEEIKKTGKSLDRRYFVSNRSLLAY